MTTILTVTEPRDSHAVYVDAVLTATGHESHLIVVDPILRDGGFSLATDAESEWLQVRSQHERLPLDSIDTQWNRRRLTHPFEPRSYHPADLPFLEGSAFAFARSVSLLSEDGFAVNPARGILRGGDKFAQLRAAKAVGLRVPDTLIGNDHEEVLAFLAARKAICTKTHFNANWKTEEGIISAFTTVIRAPEELPQDAVELSPTIYQEYISKAFEVRITIFGNYVAASKILVPEDPDLASDWRQNLSYLNTLQAFSVEDWLLTKLKQIMSLLDIRFGTFDLAMSREGEWVFFEVNEAGQFIWQELHSEDTMVLEPFARYLASKDDQFTFDPRTCSAELSAKALRSRFDSLPKSAFMKALGPIPSAAMNVLDERASAA
ncbi:MAG: hypothetical protein A2623_08820 [Caulobacterales bacterium RIFCSPHIGHO2_01_FULL_70_19]|nr:MAG: hypothetical protein A2623_08820 [Caulobacterales bacterium RIFCSPHIGHO2_01_FULL_70_19]